MADPLQTIGLLLTGMAGGAVAFFTFAGAPAAFRTLGKETAGTYVRAVFPVYHLALAVATGLAALLLAWHEPGMASRILAVTAAFFIVQRRLILPRMERYRAGRERGEDDAAAAFRRLHGVSMAINLAQLGAIVAAFWIGMG